MLPLVTEFSIILPEFSLILPEFPRFFKILGVCDTPPHPPVATPLRKEIIEKRGLVGEGRSRLKLEL